MLTESNIPLRCLPVDLIELNHGVIIKRGCAEFHVSGDGATEVIRMIVERTSGDGATHDEIVECFAEPDREAISGMIEAMQARNFVVPVSGSAPAPSEDTNLEIFYWNFGQTQRAATARLNEQRVGILGVNHISRQIAATFQSLGYGNFMVVDHPLLRNLRLFDRDGRCNDPGWSTLAAAPMAFAEWERDFAENPCHCIVATSDFGGLSTMRDWNEFCVERRIHFLPVVLQNMVGYVGPFVVPGETPCFECARARQNANFQDPVMQRASEARAFESQNVIGFHPAAASILGDIAAMEISKHYGGWTKSESIGSLIVVRMLVPSITMHRVLKTPRCSVCSNLNKRASIVIEKGIYMPGNREET